MQVNGDDSDVHTALLIKMVNQEEVICALNNEADKL
jgi:hypothetical protein